MFSKTLNSKIFLPPRGYMPMQAFASYFHKGYPHEKEDNALGIRNSLHTVVVDGNWSVHCLRMSVVASAHIFALSGGASTIPTKTKQIQLLYFHGNAETIVDCYNRARNILKYMIDNLPDYDCGDCDDFIINIHLIEFPGYGSGDVKNIDSIVISQWASAVSEYTQRDMIPGLAPMVILWGYSLGASMAARCLYKLRPFVKILIAEAMFPSVTAISKNYVKKQYGSIASTIVPYFLDNSTYEYFNSRININMGKGDAYVISITSDKDEICGEFIDDIRSMKNDGIIDELIETTGGHAVHLNQLRTYDTTMVLLSKISKILCSEELHPFEPMSDIQGYEKV